MRLVLKNCGHIDAENIEEYIAVGGYSALEKVLFDIDKDTALDMMEEFRAYLADRLTLTLINRRQIRKTDFMHMETGAVVMKEKARKNILTVWQERKREEVEHPFLRERMTIGQLFHVQARLLSRYIRGDMEAYPPFSIR